MTDTLKQEKINLGILISLFLLRFVLLFLSYILSRINSIYLDLGSAIYHIGTFTLTGLFIRNNIQNLNQFNISKLALFIFLFSPVFSIIADPHNFIAYINILIAIKFCIDLFPKRGEIILTKTPTNNIVSNIIITLTTTVAVIIIGALTREFKSGSNLVPLNLSWIIRQFLLQLSFAAAMEEPLFRGFLWGYLKKYKLSDITICIIQAFLFWFGHIYYMNTGLNFWIFHPIAAFSFGLIIIKTKNIAYSLISHALINTIVPIFMFYYNIR